MIFTESVREATLLADQGNFQSAVEVLGELWPGCGVEPARYGECDIEYAKLLMVCGILTVEIGKFTPAPTQSSGKDLLSKAARLFGDDPHRYMAQFWLATSYLLCGENREALSVLDIILVEQAADSDVVFRAGRTKALALLNLGDTSGAESAFAAVEVLLETAEPASQGKFFLNRGMMFRQTGRLDEAIADYEMAGRSFFRVGNIRLQAAAQNNAAGVYMEQGRFSEAHVATRSALLCFRRLRDKAHEAKVLDQIAQIYGREENYVEMGRHALEAVAILATGDHEGWLAEALITLGSARARLGMAQAQEALSRALAICERQGDPKQAEAATAAMWDIVRQGQSTQNDIREALSSLEREVYVRMLEKHHGHVSPAAHELGYSSHQAFLRRLNNHFPELTKLRTRLHKRHCSVVKVR